MKSSPKTAFKKYQKILLLLLFYAFVFIGKSDAQGCECTTCNGPITPVTTDTYTLNISGATNNNLGDPNQGVCGISIDFNANHVWSLTVTLTSPSGQVITLIGPYDNFGGTTSFTNWDISFLPCSETAMPDQSPVSYTPQWSNLQAWAFFENYTGSYYPYIGCLEDFNSGPVNGDWTLTVINGFANMNSNTGTLNGFSLIFCDDDGTGCGGCNAFAGDLSGVNDIGICEGDNFNGNIDPFYSFGTEPNNQYSYDYIISQNNTITNYESNPDFSTYPQGIYEVCGLSYLTADAGNIPAPNGTLSVADLENLLITTAPFCGDITDDCFTVEVFAYPDTVFIQDDFCQGTPYIYGGNNYNTAGVHYINLPSLDCDTTVELTLTELMPTSENIEITICQGDTFFIENNFYTTTGNYVNNLTSTIGCDSMINLDLTVLNPESNIAPPTIIDCTNLEIELDGATSTAGTGVTYLWSTSTGSIISDVTENTVTVDAAGKYFLTVTVNQNGTTCSETDSVTVVSIMNLPNVNAGADSILNCAITDIVLDGSASAGGGFSYEWTTSNGNIVQDTFTLNALIDAAGTYVLSVTNLNNNCVAEDSVVITIDNNLPQSDAGDDLQINCNNATVMLDGTNSSTGAAFIYQWTTGDGNILLGENTLTPTVDSAGTYELLVTDTFNHCSAMETVMVTVDTIPPIADAGNEINLDCLLPQTQIDATNSSQGNNFSYQWTVVNGAPLVNGQMTLTPTVDGAGVYELLVTNNSTGCTSTSQVTVNQSVTLPNIVVEMPIDTITCLETSIIIDAGNSSVGNDFDYLWTEIGLGNIVSGGDGLFPEINEAGMYELEITNTQNGCTILDTVEVFSNNTFPNANAGGDLVITCNDFEINLNGSGDTGSDFDVMWNELNGGNIVSGNNSLSPLVDAAGDYELVITNTSNGCFFTDTTNVTVDTIPPIADAGNEINLDCLLPQTQIDATNSSQGNNFSYQWTVVNGAPLVNGQMTLTPTVDGAGVYELLVTNNSTGCTSTSQVTVNQDFTLPSIVVEMPIDTITCLSTSIIIDAGNSSVGNDFDYLWTEIGLGNIVSGGDGLFPEINEAGMYELEITNTQNGCSILDTVEVFSNNTFPNANAGGNLIITCNDLEINLNGSGDTGSDFDVVWNELNGGNIVSGNNSFSPLVDAAGEYELVITNTSTGCFITDTTMVTIDTIPPIADAGNEINLDCTLPQTQIDATNSSQGNNFSYQWTVINGAPLVNGEMTLTPTVNGAGVYELLVTNTSTGCTATSQVTVNQDFTLPIVVIEMPIDTITCLATSIIINAGNSSVGNDFDYAWTEIGMGNIVSGGDGLFPEINQAGMYELEITNTQNGCSILDTVEVFSNNTLPNANAGSDLIITCNDLEINLNGSGDTGNDFDVMWNELNGGNIVSGNNSLTPLVDAAGDYELVITNTSTGCFFTDTTSVTVDTIPPIANAGNDSTINCFFPTIMLDGSGSSVGDFDYEWSTSNGSTVTNPTTLQPTITAGGYYELLVTNNQNGCTAIDSVFITPNFSTPIADAGVDTFLSCANPIIFLNGNNSSIEPDLVYQWLPLNGGNILSGGDSLEPEVNTAGTYQLNIINTLSGCVSIDEVIVTTQNDLPIANAGLPDTITCAESTIFLNANNSSTGNDFSYEWTTVGGNILNGGNTLTPEVDSAGSYILTVTNDDNGCMSMSNVQIEIDTLLPMVNAGIDTSFTCVSTLLQLNGAADLGNEFSYNWTTSGVGTIDDATILNPIIDDEGTYELEVTNSLNGCVTVDEVEVFWDTLAPVADTGMDTILDCNIVNVVLGGNSSMGNNIQYLWTTTPDGNIISDPTNANISVNTGAVYTLTVTNTDNNCSSTDEVEVMQDIGLPSTIVVMPDTVECGITQIVLDGGSSSIGNDFTYEWTTVGGNIVSDTFTLTPTIDAAGTYILTVTNTANQCEATTSVDVVFRNCTPVADAGADADINCNQSVIILDGSGSSIGSDYNYEWTTPDGNIVSDTFTLFPTVDAQGTYFLTVENVLSGLTAVDSVLVTESLVGPSVVLEVNDSLDCSGNNVLVNGAGSSSGFNYLYSWSTNNGNIVSIVGLANISVSQPGFYILEIENTDNGCVSIDSIEVFQDVDVPVADAGNNLELNCYNSQLTIDGSNSSVGNNIIYTWTTVGGNIVSGENTATPIIDSSGIYILEVVNSDNGCTNIDSTIISENYIIPIADAGNPDTLNCLETTLSLDGSASSMGIEMINLWTTDDGNILLGENTLSPQIDSAGTYELIVTNNLNGCADTSTVVVEANFSTPIANAGMDTLLDCGISNIILDGSNSSMGSNLNYAWTTNGGNIQSGANSLTPEVTLGGIYILTIENTESGCVAIDSTVVTTVNCAPSVTILLPDTLTCTIGEITLDGSNSSDWQTITYAWTIVGNGNITGPTDEAITTVDQPGNYQLTITDTQNGNIAFGGVTVVIDDVQPIANAGFPDTLNCAVSQLTLDGSASDQGNIFQYQWNTIGGNIINGQVTLTPEIDTAATYELVVTNTENGCTNNSFVVIEIDTIAPTAVAGNTMNLTCVDTLLQLDGFGSSTGSDFTYQWDAIPGNIVNGATTLFPQINAAGTYEITVLNNHNFCEASSIVNVGLDTISPTILFETPEILNCAVTEISLDATNSSSGSGFSFLWGSMDGNIVNGETGLTPLIDDGGDYSLTILNFQNGCISTDNITVIEDTIPPIANAGNTVELTCVDTLLSLDGSASSQGSEFLYQWNTGLGNIVSGVNTISPNINLSGEYELIVTNNNNMCTGNSFVEVTQNIIPPIAIIETPDTLNCSVASISINANNSSNGLNFNYLWNTNDGNIENGETTLTPQVNDGGDYDLTITNMENGCTITEIIAVMQDTISPIASAGMEMTLTCSDTLLTLDGSGSSQGSFYNYSWTSSLGNIVSGENSMTPIVDELGDYEIFVINNNNQCTSTNLVQISQDTIAPEIEIEVIGGLVLNCDIGSVVLDASGSLPLGNISFQWNTGNGNILTGNTEPNPEVDLAGEYFLILTNDSNGCTATEMVTITDDFEEPIINIVLPDTLTCVDTVINLSGQGSSEENNIQYTWTTSDGNIVSGADELEAIIDTPGTYSLTVLNTDNGCFVSETITVFENVIAPFADAGGAYEFDCIQSEKMLQATASQGNEFIYQWNTSDGNIASGVNTLEPIVDAFGTYVLTVTNTINGCVTTSSAVVTEDLDVPENLEVKITLPLCYGDANGELEVINIIGGEPPYEFALDNQPLSSNNLFGGLAAGNYLISVRDVSGCEFEKIIDLPQQEEIDVDLGNDQYLELGESTTLEAITNIPPNELDTAIWTTTGILECEDCLEQFITPLHTAGYTVFLSNENGCTTTDTVIVYVNNKRRIFIPNAFSPNGDGYNDKFVIYGGIGVEEIEQFQIFSRWGELVFQRNNFQPNDEAMGWDGVFKGQKMNSAVFVFYAKVKYTNGESEVIKGDLFLK